MIKKFYVLSLLVFLILILPLLNLLVLYKSFSLGLYGDDWLQLYNLWLEFEVRKSLSFFDIRSYLGAYLPQYIFLGIIHNFAGYDPRAYFFTSFLLKVFSGVGVYFFAKAISKNALTGILSAILFILSAAGLEATDWVFNMNTFAGLGFFSLAVCFYLKVRKSNKLFSKKFFLFIIFLSLSLFVVPVRMHGAVPFLIISDLFLTFITEKKKFPKLLVFRILTSILILFIFVKAGSYGTPEYSRARILDAFKLVQPNIEQGKFDFVFYFFGTIGNIIIPDRLTINPLVNIIENNFLLRKIPFSIPLVFSLIFFLIDFSILKAVNKKSSTLVLTAISGLTLTLIGIFIKTVNPAIPWQNVFTILLGLNFFSLGICIFYLRSLFNSNFVNTIILSMFWIICFSGVYWLYSPHLILETTSRYLTFGAFGVAVFLAALVAESFRSTEINFWKTIPLGLLIFYLLTHFYAGQIYLSNLEKNRNQFLTQKTWNNLLHQVPQLNKDYPTVFYFTTDNQASLFGVLLFGFWPRAGLEYKITEPEKTPLATEDYSELLEYVKSGEPLKKVHGRKQQPVKLENIFAFDFRNGELINRSNEIREELARDLQGDSGL